MDVLARHQSSGEDSRLLRSKLIDVHALDLLFSDFAHRICTESMDQQSDIMAQKLAHWTDITAASRAHAKALRFNSLLPMADQLQ
jgi:hypothetical protein